VVARTRPEIAAASSSVRLPFSTCLASERAKPAAMASAPAVLRLRNTTSCPLAAATSAMPAPMMPEPTIPTRVIDMDDEFTGR
jgi:hypothetical protein